MRRTWLIVSVAALLAPGAAMAASVFDGTWKLDTKSARLPTKPDVYLLQGGMFACKSCVPPYEVKADGAVHPVSGSPYFDSMKIDVVDPHTVRGERMKGGRPTGKMVETVSPDGNMLTVSFNDLTVPTAPVTGSYTLTRVGPAPAGAHAVSGSWRQDKLTGLSDTGLLDTFQVVDGVVHFSTPSGQSYVAKLDGAKAPYRGDPGINMVSVRSTGPREMTETDYRDAKIINVVKMTVGPEGRTMTVAVDDRLNGTTSQFTCTKQ